MTMYYSLFSISREIFLRLLKKDFELFIEIRKRFVEVSPLNYPKISSKRLTTSLVVHEVEFYDS